jgi:hypothetical protein
LKIKAEIYHSEITSERLNIIYSNLEDIKKLV